MKVELFLRRDDKGAKIILISENISEEETLDKIYFFKPTKISIKPTGKLIIELEQQ